MSEDNSGDLSPDDIEKRFADVLCRLREKHGKIAFWLLDDHGLVVAAKPENPKVYHNLINQLRNEKGDTAVALESFAIACTVYPEDKEVVKRVFRDLPAFGAVVAARGQVLCGSDIKELGKG